MSDYNETPFEWTVETAQRFLEARNKAAWGDRYSEDEKLRFGSAFIDFEVNRLISMALFFCRVDRIASDGQQRIADVMRRAAFDQGASVLASLSDVHDNSSEAAFERAIMMIAAAQFLGIPVDERNQVGFNFPSAGLGS